MALDLNNLHGRIRRMHHVNRYSSLPVVKPENVAAHSWQVAFISYLIAEDLAEKGCIVSPELALKAAVVHDVSEALSGDIIRSYKYQTPQMEAATRGADAVNVRQLAEELGSSRLESDWTLAKDQTLEGRIVALADVICVVTYCVEEERMGNSMLDHVLEGAYNNLLRPLRDHPLWGRYVMQLFPQDNYRSGYREPDATWRNL
jgi:5'-deoxynucleotidase YfbR-like HD superfamily hydrolase